MIGSPHILSDMDIAIGIEALSQRLLGSSDSWIEVVELNNLIPPYLTADPVAAFGSPLDEQVIITDLSTGDEEILLSANTQLWAESNIVILAQVIAGVIHIEQHYVSSYDGTTLTLDAGLESDYLPGVKLFTFPRTVTTQNVLMSGQILYLPIDEESASLVVSQDGMLTDVFGTDIKSPMSFENGSIVTVSGPAVLVQRIKAAIKTAMGSLPQAPTFGSSLGVAIGSPTQSLEITAHLRQAMLSLPEVANVTDIIVTVSGDQASLSSKLWVSTSNTPLILVNESLTLPIIR